MELVYLWIENYKRY